MYGAVQSMIKSIRENNKLRGEPKTMRDRNGEYTSGGADPLEFNDSMTKEEHLNHQEEWKARKLKSQIKLGVFFGSIVVLIGVFLVWLGS